MESFENIYLDISNQPGKCRIAESGLGWKPSGGGDTFTLDSSNISAAQWSRAARGYELKILSRTSGVIQLDGFEQEVQSHSRGTSSNILLTIARTTIASAKLLNSSTVSTLRTRNMLCGAGIGEKQNSAKQSLHLTFKTALLSKYLIQKYRTLT